MAIRARRKFLCDLSAFSITVALNDSILNKISLSLHTIGALKIDRNDWAEGKINICYLALGSTVMEIGSKLSAYFGTPMQKVNLNQGNCQPFSFIHNSWRYKLENHMEKQNISVLVSDINVPIFFDLRQHVISHATYLWTICMVAKFAKKDILDLHYAPNEITRIAHGSSFTYQDLESLINPILVTYMVQHRLRHPVDSDRIYVEDLEYLEG